MDIIIEELVDNRLVPLDRAIIYQAIDDTILKRELKIFQSCDLNLYAFTEFDYAALIFSLLPSPEYDLKDLICKFHDFYIQSVLSGEIDLKFFEGPVTCPRRLMVMVFVFFEKTFPTSGCP